MATYPLAVVPDRELTFTLARTAGTPEASLTLSHPGTTYESLAFKVKTTHPRRYLVRPNQGLIAPGGSETVSIILVECEKNVLLQAYDRRGQSALDHYKDKFRVQSVATSFSFRQQYQAAKERGTTKELTYKHLHALFSALWNDVSSFGTGSIINKKLHVKWIVSNETTTSADTDDDAGRCKRQVLGGPHHDSNCIICMSSPKTHVLFHVDTCALVEGVPFSLSNDQIHARSAEKAPSW